MHEVDYTGPFPQEGGIQIPSRPAFPSSDTASETECEEEVRNQPDETVERSQERTKGGKPPWQQQVQLPKQKKPGPAAMVRHREPASPDLPHPALRTYSSQPEVIKPVLAVTSPPVPDHSPLTTTTETVQQSPALDSQTPSSNAIPDQDAGKYHLRLDVDNQSDIPMRPLAPSPRPAAAMPVQAKSETSGIADDNAEHGVVPAEASESAASTELSDSAAFPTAVEPPRPAHASRSTLPPERPASGSAINLDLPISSESPLASMLQQLQLTRARVRGYMGAVRAGEPTAPFRAYDGAGEPTARFHVDDGAGEPAAHVQNDSAAGPRQKQSAAGRSGNYRPAGNPGMAGSSSSDHLGPKRGRKPGRSLGQPGDPGSRRNSRSRSRSRSPARVEFKVRDEQPPRQPSPTARVAAHLPRKPSGGGGGSHGNPGGGGNGGSRPDQNNTGSGCCRCLWKLLRGWCG
ncbi:hypothetical protein N656DRAFT_793886 [Canariomyces notabilis]|uniref:Uncharacterized protein n=1 Tax=Canariomyces notabilis TaxID=2074819 RepID=A0AAN6TMZ9_9PEZI|nr:hypothetical protein N656DRAFT_793886 [Canariomyces arenarius]